MKKCPPGLLKTWDRPIYFICRQPVGLAVFHPAQVVFRPPTYTNGCLLLNVSRPSSFFGCLWLFFARSRLSLAADFRLMPADVRQPVGF